MSTHTRTATGFIVKGVCRDNDGKDVILELGTVRGMTDNGQPGWTNYSGTLFRTLDEAREAARHPAVYSCYGGVYHGGKVGIVKRTTTWVTTIEDEDVEP